MFAYKEINYYNLSVELLNLEKEEEEFNSILHVYSI